jgi:hypothetical protein
MSLEQPVIIHPRRVRVDRLYGVRSAEAQKGYVVLLGRASHGHRGGLSFLSS